MARGKVAATMLGIAGAGMLALGLSSTPASADRYCGPGYHWYAGYCYANPRPIYYPPPAYYPAYPAYPTYAAPVVVAPTVGLSFGIGGGHHWR